MFYTEKLSWGKTIYVLNNIQYLKLFKAREQSSIYFRCTLYNLELFLFLHKVRNKEEMEYKYYCGCRAFKIQPAARDVTFRKCVHLYACVVAFASDLQLAQEFSYYINLIQR